MTEKGVRSLTLASCPTHRNRGGKYALKHRAERLNSRCFHDGKTEHNRAKMSAAHTERGATPGMGSA